MPPCWVICSWVPTLVLTSTFFPESSSPPLHFIFTLYIETRLWVKEGNVFCHIFNYKTFYQFLAKVIGNKIPNYVFCKFIHKAWGWTLYFSSWALMHLAEQNKNWINAYASEFFRLWKLILYVEAQAGLMDKILIALWCHSHSRELEKVVEII